MDFTQLLLPLQFIVAFVFFVMSVFGNLMVLIVMLNKKTLRQTSANYYIISIAIVDFVSGAFAIPFFAYGVVTRGPHNYNVCIWMTSSIFVLFGISINLLVALSANRYWAVCHPTSYYTTLKESGYEKWMILTCFVVGSFMGTLPALGWNSGIFNDHCYLIDLVSFSYLLLCCFWTLASSVVIIILYGLIYKSLALHSKSRIALFAGNATSAAQQANHSEEIKITKTLSMVVGSFLFCWMPITIYFLMLAITEQRVAFDLENLSFGLIFLGFAITSTHLNSVIDPLIYAYRIKEVQDAIKRPFKCKSDSDVEESNPTE